MNQSESRDPAQGPLVGIRVLDFCSFINGAFAAMMMGDLGADVIKVESLTGDLSRAWGPFYRGESQFFLGWNRNKRGIALNLQTKPGLNAAYELIKRADVLLENFRSGVTKKLGIDYETLRSINPRLIYCSSTAFGSRGPYSKRPGYDPILQTMGGAAKHNVNYGGNIAICSVAVSDYQASMLAMSGILAALYHREKTGEGQLIETSLLQGIMSAQSHYYTKGLDTPAEGGTGIFPYNMFETSDDRIFIGAPTNKFWLGLCEALGADDLAADPRYDTNSKRVLNKPELIEAMNPYFKSKTTDEWIAILVEKGVPCAPVKSFDEFFVDEQVEAMEMNPVKEHPTIGRLRQIGLSINFEKTPGAIQSTAPLLGQHTEEILREAGYDDDGIEDLRRKGAIPEGVS